MKVTKVVFALLYSSQVSAVQLRDIFDAYDEESKKEAKDHSDTIDPVALAQEIGGDQIAKEVKKATAGVADQALLQLDEEDMNIPTDDLVYIPSEDIFLQMTSGYKPRRILDEDGDGVEDNMHKTQWELDRFRRMVFTPAVEDLHNTRNGKFPGHHNWGEDPEPGTDPFAEADAADKAREINRKAEKAKRKAEQDAAAAKLLQKQADDAANVQMNDDLANSEYDEEPQSMVQQPYNIKGIAAELEFNDIFHNTFAQNKQLMSPEEIEKQNALETKQKKEDKQRQAEEAKKIADQQAAALSQKMEFQRSTEALSLNEYDTEYVQVKLADFVNKINGPDDLEYITNDESFLQTEFRRGGPKLFDQEFQEDGTKDTMSWDGHSYDRFYRPNVFGAAIEDIFNTRTGHVPGKFVKEFSDSQTEPASMDLVIRAK